MALMTEEVRRRWLGPRAAALAAAALAVLLYFPSLQYDFTYDDIGIIVNDERIDRLSFLWQMPFARWWSWETAMAESRPLTTFTLWLQVHLHGKDPLPFHAVNVLLYAALSAQLALFAFQLTGRAAAAWVTGLVFAAHPIHVETVANVVGRAETLSALCSVAAVSLYLRWRPSLTWGRAAWVGLLILLAGQAKESGYLTAPIIGAFELALRRRDHQPLLRALPWRMIVMIGAVAVLAVVQRLISLQSRKTIGVLADLDNPLVQAEVAQKIVTPFKLIGKAASLLTVPVNQSPDYSPSVLMPTSSVGDPLVQLGMVVTLIFAACLALAWWKRHLAAALLLATAICWAVPSNTFFYIGTIFGERLLMGVSIWGLLALVVVWPADAMRALRLGAAGAVTLAVIGYSLATIFYLPAWRDNVSLTLAAVTRQPLSGRFQGMLALKLMELGVENPEARQQFFADAEKHARLALEYWSRQTEPYEVLGVIAMHRGQKDLARQYLRMAQTSVERFNQGELALMQLEGGATVEQLKQRRLELEKQYAAAPEDADVIRALAEINVKLKRNAEAQKLFEKLSPLTSSDTTLLDGYISASLGNLDIGPAVKAYQRWLELDPRNWSVLTDAALVAMTAGDHSDLARRWIDEAIRISPGSAEPWAALALWHQRLGRYDEAIAAVEEALRRSGPDDPKRAHYQLLLRNLKNQ